MTERFQILNFGDPEALSAAMTERQLMNTSPTLAHST